MGKGMSTTTALQPALWEAPEITQINRLPIHATFHPYDSVDEARRRDPTRSPWGRSLNGMWNLRVLANPSLVTEQHISGALIGGGKVGSATGMPLTSTGKSRVEKARASAPAFAFRPVPVPADGHPLRRGGKLLLLVL